MNKNFHRNAASVAAMIVMLVFGLRATGQSFDLSWHTVDGGGAMNTAGGDYVLAGTIGQPDAQTPPVMSGGSFELVGGFWPAAAPACACPSDMNGDMLWNGLDIQQFVECVVAGGACNCADVDGVPGVDVGDVDVFVAALLVGDGCP